MLLFASISNCTTIDTILTIKKARTRELPPRLEALSPATGLFSFRWLWGGFLRIEDYQVYTSSVQHIILPHILLPLLYYPSIHLSIYTHIYILIYMYIRT